MLDRECTLKEVLHERQRRLEREVVAKGVLEAVFELELSVIEVGLARQPRLVKYGLVCGKNFIMNLLDLEVHHA